MTIANMPPRSLRQSWLRHPRFSVRGLLMLVLLIGGCLGWIVRIVRSAQTQREAVATVNEAGGDVLYDWQFNDGKALYGREPWAPDWLVNCLGPDYFGHVTGVVFGSKPSLLSSSSRLVDLRTFPRLQLLIFDGPTPTDGALSQLKDVKSLQDLYISCTDLTDGQLAKLTELTSLESLEISSNKRLTDAGLASVKGMKRLSRLWLRGSRFTDAGLAHLSAMTNLSELYLDETQITDAGLVHLKGLTKLKKLNLSYTKVTDAGLVHLKGLTGLLELKLVDTRVTDAGVYELRSSVNQANTEHGRRFGVIQIESSFFNRRWHPEVSDNIP